MREDQETISDWATSTFGEPRDLESLVARLNEEMAELISAVNCGESIDVIMNECADVYIVLCQLPDLCGYDLEGLVNQKMAVNRARTWKTDGRGTGQHE